MAEPREDSLEHKFKDIAQVGGWSALAIGVVTAATLNAALQALVLGVIGGQPKLDVKGANVILDAFLITAPMAIAVMIVAIGAVRIEWTGGSQPYGPLIFVATSIVVGLVAGNVIYQAIYRVVLEVNYQDMNSTIAHVSGPPYIKLAAGIIWFAVGYYEFYGFGHFIASIIAGGFAAYVVHRMLPAGALARI